MADPPSDNPVAQIPRHKRLAFRAMLVVLLVAALMTGGSSLILIRTVEARLHQVMSRETLVAAERVIEQVRRDLTYSNTPGVLEQIDSLLNDPKLTFIIIEDAEGRELARGAGRTSTHLNRFDTSRKAAPAAAPLELARPQRLSDAHAPEATICRNPVFAASGAHSPANPRLVGYVTVGVNDPVGRAAIENVRAAALGAICVSVLLAIPLTDVLIRYLTRPIRRMARATAILAAGGQPLPLAVYRGDEIGVLARSFDDMARNLAAAQSKLRSTNASLEKQVQERTQQLGHVNDLLRREIDTKNEFLRTVSHDLSAPLRNIAGMTTMIQRRYQNELPREVIGRLERIAANVEMEFSMLGDLLELSRLRTRPFEPTNVDLHDAILNIIEALAHETAERGVTCRIENRLPVVFLEPNLIRQVFLNLIDNAVKYMGDRPERLITIRSDADEQWLRVTVKDTGPGIPADEHERVFKVFQRGALSRNSEVAGRGIGLTSVNMVVERWGGRIHLESEVGRGSAFSVLIPAGRVVRNAAPANNELRVTPIPETNRDKTPGPQTDHGKGVETGSEAA